MRSKLFEALVVKFAVFSVVVFVVLELFELAVFGSMFYFSSVILGQVVPTSILYSVLLGVVFATAQYVLNPRDAVCDSACLPTNSGQESKKKSASKKKGKKKK